MSGNLEVLHTLFDLCAYVLTERNQIKRIYIFDQLENN